MSGAFSVMAAALRSTGQHLVDLADAVHATVSTTDGELAGHAAVNPGFSAVQAAEACRQAWTGEGNGLAARVAAAGDRLVETSEAYLLVDDRIAISLLPR